MAESPVQANPVHTGEETPPLAFWPQNWVLTICLQVKCTMRQRAHRKGHKFDGRSGSVPQQSGDQHKDSPLHCSGHRQPKLCAQQHHLLVLQQMRWNIKTLQHGRGDTMLISRA